MINTKPLNILIVDDSEIIRERIIEKLNKSVKVIKVGEADNYRNALKQFISSPPEIMILDLQLKDGDGMDLLHIVKSKSPETHVIILTNFPYPALREFCSKLGAEYFFDKSNDFEKLPFAVSQIFACNSTQKIDFK